MSVNHERQTSRWFIDVKDEIFYQSLDDVIGFLTELKAEHPHGILEDVTDSYDSMEIALVVHTPETDDQYAHRIALETEREKRHIANELKSIDTAKKKLLAERKKIDLELEALSK